ncbi:MAG: orotate phosphoribosyltransferase [Planctomycetota bacterium]|nr:orotate phosphoribosyltransferase [Planctomycetota bacterium]
MAKIPDGLRSTIDRRVAFRSESAFLKKLEKALASSSSADLRQLLFLARRYGGVGVGLTLTEKWSDIRNLYLMNHREDFISEEIALSLYELSLKHPGLRERALKAMDVMLRDPVTSAESSKQIRLYRHLIATKGEDKAQKLSREEIATNIATAALLRGNFTLRSGRKSKYYLDKYLFSTRPELLREIARLFAERIAEIDDYKGDIDRLAGAELGGIPLVTATSLETGVPCVFVRNQKKDYGTAKLLEGKLEPGDRTIILEDVATSGGQAVEAVKTLRDAGAKPVAVIAVIDRQEGATETVEGTGGVPFSALFTRSDLGIKE